MGEVQLQIYRSYVVKWHEIVEKPNRDFWFTVIMDRIPLLFYVVSS